MVESGSAIAGREKGSFRDRVTMHFDQLTAAQQDLAQQIANLGEQVAFMTARQLAQAVGQSDAAIIRFAKVLGYGGFPDMRAGLRARILEHVGASGMRQASRGSDHVLLEEIVARHADMLTETARLNDPNTILSVADLLVGARRIYVVGHGTTYPLAVYLAMHLNQSLDRAQIFNIEHGDLAERFRSVGDGDVFIGIGYVRYLQYTIDILRLARDSGATVVAITDRASSPLARLARLTLYPARATDSAAWWSQAGTLLLGDWLNALVLSRDATTADHLRRSDEELKRLGHWKSDGSGDLWLEQRRQRGLHGLQDEPAAERSASEDDHRT